MTDFTLSDAGRILCRFFPNARLLSAEPFGGGHINRTYLLICEDGKYVLQRLSAEAFADPDGVMENIFLVTEHLRTRVQTPDGVMTFFRTESGERGVRDGSGFWRLSRLVDGLCLDRPDSPQDFAEAGFGFGAFGRLLSDFPAEKLHETIPDFHNTPKRLAALALAAKEDAFGRAHLVQEELSFALSREPFSHTLCDACASGRLPLRVTHNDTKINNVILDRTTRKAKCVIDLDTVMPGLTVTDFGDAIRYGASTAAEDEPDLSRVLLDTEFYTAFARGYLSGWGDSLTDAERRFLPEGAMMMMLECGSRFLTDFLRGDTYFRTAYPDHNLIRCRTQFRLLSHAERLLPELRAAL